MQYQHLRRRHLLVAAAAGVMAVGAIRHAYAQADDYPARPVRVVVPYAAGGATDILTRIYAQYLSEKLGRPFIVDPKPGATTNIAANEVANAAADGYTLLVSNFATNLANKYSFKNLRYDPLAFENVGMMARNTMFVVVSANSRFKSFKDLIAAGRERQLSYASNGYGSPPHLAAELLGKSARLKLLHIPYKGSTESYADLRSGRVDFAFDGGTAKPMIDAGALRMLAVTVPERWPLMPDVPTMIEEGAPGAAVATFFGLVAPKGTPAAILDKLSAALLAANADPAVLKQLPPLGMVPFTANRAQTASFFTAERAKWKPVIESSGIQLD